MIIPGIDAIRLAGPVKKATGEHHQKKRHGKKRTHVAPKLPYQGLFGYKNRAERFGPVRKRGRYGRVSMARITYAPPV